MALPPAINPFDMPGSLTSEDPIKGTRMLELSCPPGTSYNIEYEMVGGIVRIHAFAVTRRGREVINEPLTIVMRVEDAAILGPRLLGEIGAVRDFGFAPKT
jgi:hypothetical protein